MMVFVNTRNAPGSRDTPPSATITARRRKTPTPTSSLTKANVNEKSSLDEWGVTGKGSSDRLSKTTPQRHVAGTKSPSTRFRVRSTREGEEEKEHIKERERSSKRLHQSKPQNDKVMPCVTLKPLRYGINKWLFASEDNTAWSRYAIDIMGEKNGPDDADVNSTCRNGSVDSACGSGPSRRATSPVKLLCELLNKPAFLRLNGSSAGGTYMVSPAMTTSPLASSTQPPASATGGITPNECIAAVFKPRCEEIGQARNPHGNHSSERIGEFAPGTGSVREVLAYLLDHEGSAGVMPTLEVCAVRYTTNSSTDTSSPFSSSCGCSSSSNASGSIDHSSVIRVGEGNSDKHIEDKHYNGDNEDHRDSESDDAPIGSLQYFVPGCLDAADLLPGGFPVEEVHRIAIFDIRTLNSDRHGGNILVSGSRTNTPHLIPIDHSYICPSGFADPEFEWMCWPQTKVPFSEASLAYIAGLNVERDAALVYRVLVADEAVSTASTSAAAAAEVLQCTTRLLQMAALQYGLTAYSIGQLCRRRTFTVPSVLEELMAYARDNETWHVHFPTFERLLSQRLKQQQQQQQQE